MRQRATWLVVVALMALGTAAVVDALRGGERRPEQAREADRRTTTRRSEPASAVVQLAPAAGLNGMLYYTDQDCRLRALRLPGLQQGVAPQAGECEFSLAPSGRAIQPSWVVWSPDGASYAAENGDSVEIDSGRVYFNGSVPAWRPDGILTYVREGAVRAWPSRRILLSGHDLRRAAAGHPKVPEDQSLIDSIRVKRMAWLSSTRVVLVLGADVHFAGEFDVAAVFERRRLVAEVFGFRIFDRLWTSPGGSFFAVGGTHALELYDRRGEPRPLPPLTGPKAIAWSPDETWAAVATRASIYLFRIGRAIPRTRRLAIEANDLAWRAIGAPELGKTGALSRRLERAGARGSLYLADADCRIRSLRVPELTWSDPVGVRAPCRFSVGPSGVSDEWIVWQERGPLGAGCHAHGVDVFALGDRSLFHRGGACHPAWRPNGSLTYVVAGRLILARRFRTERTVLAPAEVVAEFGPRARLEEVGWIDNDSFAAVVHTGTQRVLALRTDDRWTARSRPFARIAGLRVGARMMAARTTEGITFFDRQARVVMTFPNAHAVAWSRGPVAAVADRRRVYFVAPPSKRVWSLPVYAADVEWR